MHTMKTSHCVSGPRQTMDRRAFLKASAASALLFNVGCAGFGRGRAVFAGKGTYAFDGFKTGNAVADAHACHGYRKGWEIA